MLQIQTARGLIAVPLAIEAHGAEAIEAFVAAAQDDPNTLEGLPFASRAARDLARRAQLPASAFRVARGQAITIDQVRGLVPLEEEAPTSEAITENGPAAHAETEEA